jgi:hypothetical protein
MRFADTIEATAVSLSPTWRTWTGRTAFTATGMLSHLAGAWSNSTLLDGSWMSSQSGLSWEAEGIAGGSAHSDGSRTAQMMAFGRAHFGRESAGAWLGAGVGTAWDIEWRNVLQVDAGARRNWDRSDLIGRLRPTMVDDTIRYTDLELAAHHRLARWQLDASLGLRAGDPIPTLPANHKAWGSASAAFQMSPRLALVASAGSYPIDFTQGYPGGRYLSVSVRFQSFRGSDLEASTTTSDEVVREFRVELLAPSRYRLRVHAPSANSVDVAGDFTKWSPVALVRHDSGWWVMTAEIPDGTHEAAIRVDGGPWRAPPGLTPITDEFGGRSGLLIIPP